MKKLVIPAILLATVLVAGVFAVMPVQKASSIHTTILAALGTPTQSLRSVSFGPAAAVNGDFIKITTDKPIKVWNVIVSATGGDATSNFGTDFFHMDQFTGAGTHGGDGPDVGDSCTDEISGAPGSFDILQGHDSEFFCDDGFAGEITQRPVVVNSELDMHEDNSGTAFTITVKVVFEGPADAVVAVTQAA